MQSAEENNHIVVKLDNGENLFEALFSVMEKHKIDSAVILSGIGMLKEFEIGYYNGEKYENKDFVEPMELLSMHGSIAGGNENRIHIHVSLANKEHKVIGGHLMKATVCMLNEIAILKLGDIALKRQLNEKSGLLELAVSDRK